MNVDVRMVDVGEFMRRMTIRQGVVRFKIIHKPGCATERNTLDVLCELAPRLGQPDALRGFPVCDCETVKVEFENEPS